MKKIIIADNVSLFLRKKKNLLNRANFRVFAAGSNEEAIRLHETEKVDLIITNLDMPDISGEDMCSRIRRSKGFNEVSIIIICSDSQEDMDRASKCKANAVVTRPLNPELLIEKAVYLLNIPRRESFRVLISARVEGNSSDASFLCNLVNISVSGMLIETSRDLSKGDRVSCSFFLPDHGRISVNGSIVRVANKTVDLHEYGMKFAALSFEVKSAIEDFVKSKMKKD